MERGRQGNGEREAGKWREGGREESEDLVHVSSCLAHLQLQTLINLNWCYIQLQLLGKNNFFVVEYSTGP